MNTLATRGGGGPGFFRKNVKSAATHGDLTFGHLPVQEFSDIGIPALGPPVLLLPLLVREACSEALQPIPYPT